MKLLSVWSDTDRSKVTIQYLFALLVSWLCLTAGCKPREEVGSYTTQRTSPPAKPFQTAQLKSQLDQMWVAMLPLEDKVWFFKLAGKAPAVERQKESVADFISSVAASDSEETPLRWELPDGWTAKGRSEMRFETLIIPDGSGELELAISSLPGSEDWRSFVTMNVTRWLGQLSQPELPMQTILNLTEQLPTAAGKATVIELSGVLKQMPGIGRDPHGGLGMPPVRQVSESAETKKPASSTSSELTFDVPEGWQPGRAGGMRKAAFNVTEDEATGEVTVIAFPTTAGPQITDVSANMTRWAGQAGVVLQDDLEKYTTKLQIAGEEATMAEFLPPEGSPNKIGILGAMVTQGDKVWYFKLSGPRELLESQGDEFRSFLESVRFP